MMVLVLLVVLVMMVLVAPAVLVMVVSVDSLAQLVRRLLVKQATLRVVLKVV